MNYDNNNIFAKMISGEVAVEKIYEDEFVIAINDINPVAPTHILVIPKGQYKDFADFTNNASAQEVLHYFKAISTITKEQDLDEYRLISNKGEKAGQSVFHFHTHIVGGLKINGLIDRVA